VRVKLKDGILIINKPQWYTSFDVVAKLRRILNTKKVGHTGTLEPMATGVMVVCIGKATKLVDKITCEEKSYRTTIKLGIKTDTGDMTGTIIGADVPYTEYDGKKLSEKSKLKFEDNVSFANSLNASFSFDNLEATIRSFVGKQKQKPPMYSSIKIDGMKLYEYARKGIAVEVPERDIEIYDISDISFNGKDEITYTVSCSKGTYIRALNEDIAKKLGIIGTTLVLDRIKVGKYTIEEANELDDELLEDKIIEVELYQ
jgi:tRNA pseudouridine55 synthase